MVMEPGEVHVTKAISGRGTFTVLVIDPEVIIPLAAEMGIAGTPHLDPGRARAPELWRRFAGLDQALHNGDSSALCRQTLLSNALLALLSRSSERPPDNRPCDGWRAVNRAREHIHDSTGRDITLCELAGVAGISPYYLTREFTRLVGIPQHRYQMLVRTERARSLLVMGIPAVEVATLAGFADQSHMIRCFKRVWAVTPSAYMGRTCPAETARTSNRRRLPGSYDPLRRSRFGG
jgi:AraC-like DNA-binding protein